MILLLRLNEVRYVGDAVSPPDPHLYRLRLGDRLYVWLGIGEDLLPEVGTKLITVWETAGDAALAQEHPVAVEVEWPLPSGAVVKMRWRIGQRCVLLPPGHKLGAGEQAAPPPQASRQV
jgi:hypothetical protein